MAGILFYNPVPPPTSIGGIDEYTKLMLHMDGDKTASHAVTLNGSPIVFSGTTKKFVGSAYFDGTGDNLSIPTAADWNFGSADFTIDFWINFPVVPNAYDTIVGLTNGGPANLWKFDCGAAGIYSIRIFSNSGRILCNSRPIVVY